VKRNILKSLNELLAAEATFGSSQQKVVYI